MFSTSSCFSSLPFAKTALILVLMGKLLPGESLSGGDQWPNQAKEKNYRHPVAIALNETEAFLLTANSKSGSISIINLRTGKTNEQSVGGIPLDILHLGNDRFLVADFEQHRLVEYQLEASQRLTERNRIRVARYPHRLTCSDNGKKVFASSLWSRRISQLHRQDSTGDFVLRQTIDLDFAPREMVFLNKDDKLVVAGNFTGKLAVLDGTSGKQELVHQTTGHNIQGLGLANADETILVSHQMLNELAHTSRNDIHWGLLMSNDLRWIKKRALLNQDVELYQHSHMHPLGKENDAAGDPGRLAVSANGTVVVTIGGTNEVAVGKEDDFWLRRVPTGKRPLDVAIDSDGRFAFIANSGEDSISVLDLEKRKITNVFQLGPMRPLTDLEKGEQLFFDASLSHDGWMSCHSCHTNGHTNGGLNDNFTDGSFGAPKKVISLLGRNGTEPLAWNGLTPSFEIQIKNSITSTMKSGDPPDDQTVRLLTEYVKSLPAPPSLAAARQSIDPKKIIAGKKIFQSIGCGQCHTPSHYTSPETYDVGLKDELEQTRFNPPSLLGISQQSSFFHDGRAKTLGDVLLKHRHQVPKEATEEQLRSLLNFLQTL